MNTPCFVINKKIFEKNLKDIQNNFQKRWNGEVICSYSCKTNNNKYMIEIAKEFGMYAEVVSSKEYRLVKEIGFEDNKIIFNGPYKGECVYEACYLGAIVNIDNLTELKIFTDEYYKKYGKMPEKLGLRINFDLEAVVPGETSTGEEDGRFGICYENGDFGEALECLKKNKISLNGIHIHYTTKTRSVKVYGAIAEFIEKVIQQYDLEISFIDIGGGYWGGRKIEGKPSMDEYANIITEKIEQRPSTKLILEPGSALCATVVEYLTRVIAVKETRESRFVVLDGSSLHINPFQYKRNAQFVLKNDKNNITDENCKKQILCGATCLENDRFAIVEDENRFEMGDVLCFLNAGAYTMSFVSDFILDKPNVYVNDN